jgi:EmrB/QacA subfamily drug resistance transporter
VKLEYKWAATMVGIIGLFMAVLDNTIVNVALPAMESAFHTDRTTITWVVTGYFLSQAAVIPITGYLSDRFGTKLVFVLALSIFTIGSALCAFAPHENLLIAARVLQGLGGGALFPVVMAIGFRAFPASERGPASAVIGVPMLLAPAFGPTIGGYLTTKFDWNAIFLVNVPLGIIGVTLGLLILHGHQAEIAAGDESPETKGFDIPGLLLSITGVTALVYGINKAGEIIGPAEKQHARGWTDHEVLAFLLVGAVLLIIFVLYELRSRDPVMDMRLFGNYTFAVTNILTWVMSGVLFGSLFLIPIFFEQVQGKTPLSTGEILIPQGLMAAVGVAISGWLYNRVGPRPLIIMGLILTVVGSYGFTNLSVTTDSTVLQMWLVIRGVGLGLANIPLQTLAMSHISNRAMARASSLVNVTRQIFAAVGITVLTTYWAQQTTNHSSGVLNDFKAGPLQAAQAQCVHQFGQNMQAVQVCVSQYASQHSAAYIGTHSMTLGLNDTFFISMIGCAVCALIAFFVGRDPNVEKLKEAAARGEQLQPRATAMIAGE